jgi:hypothetical protein
VQPHPSHQPLEVFDGGMDKPKTFSLKLVADLEEFERIKPVCVTALFDYLTETDHYLTSFGPDLEHDECCPKHAAREAVRSRGQDALTERRSEILAALYACGAMTWEAAHPEQD